MNRLRHFIVLGAINGFLAVAFGAFAAHALKNHLSAGLLEVFQTGVEYQGMHALALLAVGMLGRDERGRALNLAGWAFATGILLFSGSLYLLALTDIRMARRGHTLWRHRLSDRLGRAGLARGTRCPVIDPDVLSNRVLKNQRHLGKWARREGIEAYRLYDRDIPEFPLAIDRYADWLHVQVFEKKRPLEVADLDGASATELAEALAIAPGQVVIKHRRRQRGIGSIRKTCRRCAALHAWPSAACSSRSTCRAISIPACSSITATPVR